MDSVYFLNKFISEAIKENLIVNFRSDFKSIEKLYSKNYATTMEYSFAEFLIKLQLKGYIVRIEAPELLIFNKNWIEFLRDRENNDAQSLKEVKPKKGVKTFSEIPSINTKPRQVSTYCKVCCSHVEASHFKDDSHYVNLKFANDRDNFNKNPDFQIKIIDTEFCKNEDAESDIRIINNLNLELRNKGTTTYNIQDILMVKQKDLTCNILNFKQELKPEEKYDMIIKGTLDDFSTTIYIAVVALVRQAKTYYFEDIPVDVVKDIDHKPVAIIRGIKPKEDFSTVQVRLEQYYIPKNFQMLLKKLTKMYPEFIQRLAKVNAKGFRVWANFLKLPTTIKMDNYYDMLLKLLHIEENQMNVDIRYYDTVSYLEFVKTIYQGNQKVDLFSLQVPGLAESKPSLIKYDSVYARLQKPQHERHKYQGIVHKVREAEVHLAFHRTFNSIFVPGVKKQRFHIEFGYNRKPLRVEKQALELVKLNSIVPYFFPKELYLLKEVQIVSRNLNNEQKQAVQNIFKRKSVPYIIFGPPGTGKTVTVVEAVLQIWHYQKDSRVLICTPSNDAADMVTVRLFDIIKNTSDICRFVGYLHSKNTNKYYESDIGKVLSHRIVVSTLINAARLVNGGVKPGHFAYVFIDESGYATETESIVPVAGILNDKDKILGQLVLAGDPRQLGPRIHSSLARFCGFGNSMLERLIDTCKIYARNLSNPVPYDPQCITKLIINYRSHETILRIPNKLFYHNELKAANDNLSCLFTQWEGLKKENFPILFHNVDGDDKKDETSPSFFNDKEIKVVLDYLTQLLRDTKVRGKTISQTDVGVISPYRRQVEKIQRECQKQNWKDVKVGSVQQFQGKEMIVLIISTVRSRNINKYREDDALYDLGLMNSPRRFNVALTRPKALLIVVGNGHILSMDRYWREFIQYCKENNSVKGTNFKTSETTINKSMENLFDYDDYGPDFGRGNI